LRGSIRARLTVWYVALMVVTLTGFSAGVLWLHARWSRAQFDAELASLGAETSRVMQEELSENGNLRKAVSEAGESIDVPDRAMAILDLSGQPLGAHWHGFRYQAPVSRRRPTRSPPFRRMALHGASSLAVNRRLWATT